jgi:hypothetical protein
MAIGRGHSGGAYDTPLGIALNNNFVKYNEILHLHDSFNRFITSSIGMANLLQYTIAAS